MSRYNTYTPGTDHVDQLFSAFILKLSNCIKHILLQCWQRQGLVVKGKVLVYLRIKLIIFFDKISLFSNIFVQNLVLLVQWPKVLDWNTKKISNQSF